MGDCIIHKVCIPFARYVAILVVASVGFVTEVPAQEKILSWDGEAAARLSSPIVRLNGANGEVVAAINMETLRRLVEVKNRIAGAANQPAHLFILSGTEPNALASKKDGSPKIAINVAMINLLGDDYDAYAAIIGHELAHLVRDHGATRVVREGARSAISSVLGAILGRYGVPLSGTIADIGTTAVSRTFSRDEEREADSLGLSYMKQAGYDPMGGVRAWERMGVVAKSRGFPFLSTHPAPEERLETMRKVAQNYSTPPSILVASPASGGGNQDSTSQSRQTRALARDTQEVTAASEARPKDEVEPVRLYPLAAEQGDAQAQASLGVRFLRGGDGLPKDEVEAARLFRLAADQGNALAQASLASMYEYGRGGLTRDIETAVSWYRLAARQGMPPAITALRRLGRE